MPIPAPATAARRLADLVVQRFDLAPPVDVASLLTSRAEVRRVQWPSTRVDAIMSGLGHSMRPMVFYRATDNPLRERFTLAHELGHVMLPWHMPKQNCAIGSGVLDLPKYSPEEEADVFASCVLLPDRWLVERLHASDGDMTALLRELNEAEVSTSAALRALRRVLLAGYVFSAYAGELVIATPGTQIDGLRTEPVAVTLDRLERGAHARGEGTLNGHPVKWFRLSAPADLPSRDSSDERTPHQILVDAIALIEADEDERIRLTHVCNGKVGGALREAAGRPAQETYDSLVHRFENFDERRLLEQPQFRLWLAEKARLIERGQTKRRLRGRDVEL